MQEAVDGFGNLVNSVGFSAAFMIVIVVFVAFFIFRMWWPEYVEERRHKREVGDIRTQLMRETVRIQRDSQLVLRAILEAIDGKVDPPFPAGVHGSDAGLGTLPEDK